MYSWYPPDVLMVSPNVLNIPPHVSRYPPMNWTSPMYSWYPPDVLMVSLQCTEHPPMYSWYPSNVLNTPRCTHDIPPMYSWYPPDVLMVSPDVLNTPRCTEHPPMYWTHIIQGGSCYTWQPLSSRRTTLRAIFCKSHPTCDSRVFRISSYFNQLKIKVILEYGRNFSFIRHFVEFLGGRETTIVFQNMQSVSTSYILKSSLSVLELLFRVQVTSTWTLLRTEHNYKKINTFTFGDNTF